MKRTFYSKIVILFFLIILSFRTLGQLPYKLLDGREHRYCESCRMLIENKPVEVLFGIQINENGDIYFSMDNKQWFDKIFKNNSYGVTVDLVSIDRYACGKTPEEEIHLPMGTILPPVYRQDLISSGNDLMEGHVFTKIGKLPASLKNKQV
ncbi:MAG: hypothetical protein ABI091_09425, partial [Ferruginibacter sp.]